MLALGASEDEKFFESCLENTTNEGEYLVDWSIDINIYRYSSDHTVLASLKVLKLFQERGSGEYVLPFYRCLCFRVVR